MSLLDSWHQIESWLQTYAPASYASLPAPADPDAIRSAQDTTGLTFPEELVMSLSRHDGSGEFILPVFHRLSSARTVADEYQRLCLVERERRQQAAGRHGATTGEPVLPPEEGHHYWNPHWIPFGYDESGNSLFISLAADETNGRVGVHEKDGGGSLNQHPVFASLEALLKAVADGLNKGTMEIWGEWQTQVDHAGYLDWRSLDGDTDTT